MIKCKWLPEILKCEDFTKWDEYLNKIYEIFKRDFIISPPIFNGKKINYRKAPMNGKYEHAFIHLTHKDEYHTSSNPNDRIPDLKRAERIGWNRAIIDNYNCNNYCSNCNKILYFEEYYKSNIRCYLLFKEVRFIVIIEKRKNYNLLITGFYIGYKNVMDKYIKKYNQYQKQKTPLI